jgi:ribosomal protein S18 acetylase RimI-like enzyme
MHRRINSATVWPGATGDLSSLVSTIEAWYEDRNHPPIFKMTAAAAPGLDALLEEHGYRIEAPTEVLTRGIHPGRAGGAVEISTAPTEEWVDTFAELSGFNVARRRLLRAICDRIEPRTGYAVIRDAGSPIALGLGVADDQHLGIFELVTHPTHRGRGLAQQIIAGIIGWGAGHGATAAYLQVMIDNPAASRLYRRLGFDLRYSYWYRTPG